MLRSTTLVYKESCKMNLPCLNQILKYSIPLRFDKKYLCTESIKSIQYKCQLLIVGAGSGGCMIASKFAKKLSKCDLIVVEPNDLHYYQPGFPLVGVAEMVLRDCVQPTHNVLPPNVTWVKDKVEVFCPSVSAIITSTKKAIQYEYMVIATGMQMRFDLVKNLKEGLDLYDNIVTVCSPLYCEKTYKSLKGRCSGKIIFTHPFVDINVVSPIFPLLADHYFRKVDRICDIDISYITAKPNLLDVPKYQAALEKLYNKRFIESTMQKNLVEINLDEQIAIFQNPYNTEEESCRVEYDLLHVSPPMGPIQPLLDCKDLTNEAGFVDVNKETLQSEKFPNVFALGDCTSLPTTKTASATAMQANVLEKNLISAMCGKPLKAKYDGYAGVPIPTTMGTAIFMEHDYELKPVETFPLRQQRESVFLYLMTKHLMPKIYWSTLIKGKFPRLNRMSKLTSWYKSKK